MEGRRRDPVTALAYYYQTATRGPPDLTSQSEGQIAINNKVRVKWKLPGHIAFKILTGKLTGKGPISRMVLNK